MRSDASNGYNALLAGRWVMQRIRALAQILTGIPILAEGVLMLGRAKEGDWQITSQKQELRPTIVLPVATVVLRC